MTLNGQEINNILQHHPHRKQNILRKEEGSKARITVLLNQDILINFISD